MTKLKIKKNRGMTYIELIVVLSIFAVMSSIVMFNYVDFQAKVDIKILASDIALQIVQAQKASLNGTWNSSAVTNWKPSYGVYFDTSTSTSQKQFIYFTDLTNLGDRTSLDTINITKNNYIERMDVCTGDPCAVVSSTNLLSITFKRPNSSAVFTGATVAGSRYVQITVKSPKGAKAFIKIYPSGRVQVN